MESRSVTFGPANYYLLCDELAARDVHLKAILHQYGYPPLWRRPAGFDTLVHIILEQQVSLASAMAAYTRLQNWCGSITPEKVLQLSNADLKACYFSRQKTVYVRSLAEAFVSGKIDPARLGEHTNDEVRAILQQVKGIGGWTADVYLLFAMQRADVFPIGDLAVVNACKELMQLPAHTSREEILQIAAAWYPYRSIAAMLLWHYYIGRRKISISPAMFSADATD